MTSNVGTSIAMHDDRRSAERHVVVLQLAVLTCDHTKQLCLVVNLGRGGMRLRLFGPPPSKSLRVTMRGERAFEGKLAWQNGDMIGVVFARPLSGDELAQALATNAKGTRAPRLAVQMPVVVRSGATTCAATLINISPAGAALDLGVERLPEPAVTLTLSGHRLVHGQVRWTAGDYAGISFNAPLLLRDLQAVLNTGPFLRA